MRLRRIIDDQCGATAIEYGLVAALISVASIAAFQATGQGVQDTMTDVSGALPAPSAGAGAPPGP